MICPCVRASVRSAISFAVSRALFDLGISFCFRKYGNLASHENHCRRKCPQWPPPVRKGKRIVDRGQLPIAAPIKLKLNTTTHHQILYTLEEQQHNYFNMQEQWQSDGTELDGKATWTVENDDSQGTASSTIQVSTTGGSPMNLLCTTPPPSEGRFFFKVRVVETASESFGLSVGVVRPEEFKKGYKLKGMFYNGNLTNASAALKTSFGPHLKQGDTVVIEYVENKEDQTIQFKIFLNGSRLGTGFKIPKTETSFVPCLSLQGDMTLNADVLSENPTIAPDVPAVPFAGKWSVTEMTSSSDDATQLLWPISEIDKEMILNIEKDSSGGVDTEDLWNFSIRAANMFAIHKRILEREGDEHTLQNFNGGMVRSTQMMPPPPMQQLERELPPIMSNHWARMKLQLSDSVLEIQSENGTTMARCKRITPSLTGAACTSYKK
jgi:hypothetical protein